MKTCQKVEKNPEIVKRLMKDMSKKEPGNCKTGHEGHQNVEGILKSSIGTKIVIYNQIKLSDL